jgi:hypothetical protein
MMANYELPKSDFTPHPAGTFEGCIVAVEDKGEVETQFGLKRKLAIVIKSSSEKMDDGRPFTASYWISLSRSIKSNLYKVRSTLLGRDLTTEERCHFEDSELVNRGVGYQIVHREGKEGTVFSNVENIWPLKGGDEEAISSQAGGDSSVSF